MKNLAKIWYFILFILIAVLFIHDNVRSVDKAKEGFTITNYLENPQKYGNYKAEGIAKIINISQDHFYANWYNSDIKVLGSGIKEATLGETDVFLKFRKDGVIELINYHNYNYNYLLYAISFLALIVSLIIFFKEWKFTWRGFENA